VLDVEDPAPLLRRQRRLKEGLGEAPGAGREGLGLQRGSAREGLGAAAGPARGGPEGSGAESPRRLETWNPANRLLRREADKWGPRTVGLFLTFFIATIVFWQKWPGKNKILNVVKPFFVSER
jgi:hypothetical protein